MNNRLAIAAFTAAGYQLLAALLLGLLVLLWLGPGPASGAPDAANWAGLLSRGQGSELPFGLGIGLADMLIATGLLATMQARIREGAHELVERAKCQRAGTQKLYVNELMVLAGLGAFCSFLMVFHRPPDVLMSLVGGAGSPDPARFVLIGWDGLFSVAYTFFGMITRAAMLSGDSLDV